MAVSSLYFAPLLAHFIAHMTRLRFYCLSPILALALTAFGAGTNPAPDFKEVYDLVHMHLAGISDEDLNRAAVEGLCHSLRGKVSLATGPTASQTNIPLVSKSSVIENDVAYARVGRVDEGLAKAVGEAIKGLNATNQIKGVVLDLRNADGEDYAAAAAVANLFQSDVKPLLDWGSGPVKSLKKDDSIRSPVAVLVNSETAGAAEALAAVLRETGTALILGATTAGRAMISQEFKLSNRQQLRIATAPVKLGNGTAMSVQGIKPDIEVVVKPEDELVYLDDPYALRGKGRSSITSSLSTTDQPGVTNRPARRPRPTEADLVRARREGTNLDTGTSLVRDSEPEKPLIRDPSLARAVDLLKGLAVVRQSRP